MKTILKIVAGVFLITLLCFFVAACPSGHKVEVDETESEESVKEEKKEPSKPKVKEWEVSTEKDEMTDATNVWKSLVSDNTEFFSFPYDNGSQLKVECRYMQQYGVDVIITITDGQILCSEYNNTNKIMARFDDGEAETYTTNEPSDGSRNQVFLANPRRFINRCKKAKKIVIRVPIYQEGNQTFTFTVDKPLEWSHS